jgi:hypothetical protein
MKKCRSFVVLLLVCLIKLPTGVYSEDLFTSIEPLKSECQRARSLGDHLAERNCWYRFLALEKMDDSSISPSNEAEIETRVSELDAELKAPYKMAAKADEPDTSMDKEKPVSSKNSGDRNLSQKKRVKKIIVEGRISKEERLKKSAEMEQKARRAEEHGRLEEALKLYRLAEKLNPSDALVKGEVGRLSKEVE